MCQKCKSTSSTGKEEPQNWNINAKHRNLKSLEKFITSQGFLWTHDLMIFPIQNKLPPFINKCQTPEVPGQYYRTRSGFLKIWAPRQGEGTVKLLEELLPHIAPSQTLNWILVGSSFNKRDTEEMERDGLERVIAFMQYPEYGDSTTGSSLNAIIDTTKRWGKSR